MATIRGEMGHMGEQRSVSRALANDPAGFGGWKYMLLGHFCYAFWAGRSNSLVNLPR